MTLNLIPSNQIDDDDIFARPPRALARAQATTARITCRVCELKDDVPLTHPGPLCRACGADVASTKKKVQSWLAGVLAQMDEARATFYALQDRYPAYWAKLEDSRERDTAYTHTCKCAEHVAKGNVYGQILVAEETMHRAFEPLEIERARLERALILLDELTPTLGPGEYLIPTGVDVEQCRSCGANIVWAKTAAGKAVPLSLALVEQRGGQRITKTHFVDCPDGRGWKKS